MKKLKNKYVNVLLMCVLFFIVIAIYWQTTSYEFINYDDPMYVFHPQIRRGLTWEGVSWSLKPYFGNWSPLTLLSHMLDCQIYGLKPGGHHFTNLLLHAINAVLAFFVFKKISSEFGPRKSIFAAFLVALLFAIHPLRVESVCWISERKGLLSSFFWFLSILCYFYYSHSPNLKRYFLLIIVFMLGLTSKAMVVTLPFVFLLLDYWPLKRLFLPKIQKNVIYEKILLFCLMLSFCFTAYFTQDMTGAVVKKEMYPLQMRVTHSIFHYVLYMKNFFWPTHLGIPYPRLLYFIPLWKLILLISFLLSLSFLFFYIRRRSPWLLFGWLWFLGTFVPVIGLIPLGEHSMADRYTYIPDLGLSMMIGFSFVVFAGKLDSILKRAIAYIAFFSCIFILLFCSVTQIGYWKNSVCLFTHSSRVIKQNYQAFNKLGAAWVKKGNLQKGIYCFQKAVEIHPKFTEGYYNLAVVYSRLGVYQKAIIYYKKAIECQKRHPKAYFYLGKVYLILKKYHDACICYKMAVSLRPDDFHARFQLAKVYIKLKKYRLARKQYLILRIHNPSMAKKLSIFFTP